MLTLHPQHPPAEQSGSRKKGTTQMLAGSVFVLASAAATFMYLDRDTKKATVGVGSEGASKLKGAKHRAAVALENGTTSGHEGVLGKSGSPAGVDRAVESVRERAGDAKDSLLSKTKTGSLRGEAEDLARKAEGKVEKIKDAASAKASELKSEAERRI